MEDKDKIIVITFDDFLFRNEQNGVLPTISQSKLPATEDIKILDVCEKMHVPVTLFVPAIVAVRFPDVIKNTCRREVEIAGHGYRHEDYRNVDFQKQVRLIEKSLKLLESASKLDITGWRVPGLFVSRRIRSAIAKSRIKWCSNSRLPSFFRQLPYSDYGGKLEIPTASVYNDYDMYEEKKSSPSQFLNSLLRDCRRILSRRGLEIFCMVFHPWVEVRDYERLKTFQLFLETLQAQENIAFKTCSQVYDHFSLEPSSTIRQEFLKAQSRLFSFVLFTFFSHKKSNAAEVNWL